MDLFIITLREMQRRPGRAILTLLSIVIGVAAIVAVSLSISESRRSYQLFYQMLAGRASLEVVAQGGACFKESTIRRIANISAIRALAPLVQSYTVMRSKGKRFELLAMGIDPAKDEQVRDYELTAGHYFQNAEEVMLESGYAQSANVQVNDKVRILTRQGVKTMTVAGLLAPRGLSGFSQAGTVFMPLEAAQSYFRGPDYIDSISIVLEDDADTNAVAAEIAARLPKGLNVRQPAERARLGQNVLLSAEHGLRVASAFTMILSVFIILNTFLMNVGERKRQLAILRIVGATHGQIKRMLLIEALLMGTIGALLGMPIGLWGAKFLMGAMYSLPGSPALPPIQWSIKPFLLALCIGPAVALIGAYLPSRYSGAVSPLEGVQNPVLFEGRRISRWLPIAGIALFSVSGLLLAARIRGWLQFGFVIPNGVVFLVSFGLVIPFLLRPVGRAIAIILSPWMGVEAELAEMQLTRRSTRSGLTAGVLYIAVATSVGLGTTILTNVDDVRNWWKKIAIGDFYVHAMFIDQTTGQRIPLAESMADDLRKIDGVTNVEGEIIVTAEINNSPVILAAADFNDPKYLPLAVAQGDPSQIYNDLMSGKAVLGTVLANNLGIGPGSRVEVRGPNGSAALEVAGTITEYSVGGKVIVMERAAAQRIFHLEGLDGFIVYAQASALDRVNQELKAYCEKQGLLLHSMGDFTAMVNRIMSGIVSGLWGLLALGFAVAGFGVANTLSMNVLEQTREIGLLRAIAMTRLQLKKMVLIEALMIAVIGLLVGLIGGLINAYMIALSMRSLLGYSIPFVLHPLLLFGIVPLVLLIVLLSAWLPMRRAAGLNLLVALSYE